MSDNYDENIKGFCTECKSLQSDSYMNNNPFFQSGAPANCQFCGGVVRLIDQREKDTASQEADARRNIGKYNKDA